PARRLTPVRHLRRTPSPAACRRRPYGASPRGARSRLPAEPLPRLAQAATSSAGAPARPAPTIAPPGPAPCTRCKHPPPCSSRSAAPTSRRTISPAARWSAPADSALVRARGRPPPAASPGTPSRGAPRPPPVARRSLCARGPSPPRQAAGRSQSRRSPSPGLLSTVVSARGQRPVSRRAAWTSRLLYRKATWSRPKDELRQTWLSAPPSIHTTCPVRYAAASDTRYTTATEISSGSARRLYGRYRSSWRFMFSSARNPPASIHPAPTAFIVTPLRAHSSASARVRFNTPACAAQYALPFAIPRSASTELMFTIRPLSRVTISRPAARHARKTPVRF